MDVFGIADRQHADVQIFHGTSAATGASWQTWKKRKGISMSTIICISGGGAGGSGIVGANSAAGGGAGGSGSCQTIVTLPTFLLPDTLYVSVGIGGLTNPGFGGGQGIPSYVCLTPNTAFTAGVVAFANPGIGGNAGAASGSAVAGTAQAAATIANCPIGGLGQFSAWGSAAGAVGGTATTAGAGANVALPTTGIVCTSGAGGGAIGTNNTAGGNGGYVNPAAIGANTPIPAIYGGTGGANLNPANTSIGSGSSGLSWIGKLFYNLGGAGGGGAGSSGGNGGQGGAGGIGCGGGGSGASFTGFTAIGGGRGGDGIVIIISW